MQQDNDISITAYHRYLQGGGEMGKLTRQHNWEDTALGHPETWPQSLLSTVNTLLNSKFPMFLWWGPELIQFYNDAYRPSLGNNGKHPQALGQKGIDCWPEIWADIKPLIDQVLTTGESTWSEDQLLPIYRNGKLEDVYWTFSYSRVMDESGEAAGVLVICNETTEKVQALNSLKEAKLQVEQAQTDTEHQRDRLNRFFMQAPAGVCVLDGPKLIFELVNPSYQQLFPGRDLLGKAVDVALPEIAGKPIMDVMRDVYANDKTFEGNGLYIPLARMDDGPVEDRYFNFIYQPRHNWHGEVDGILVFVFEVTDMVVAGKQLAQEQDKLKMALEAAELGTFDLDLQAGTMEWDERCRTLFGISHKNAVTYEHDFVNGLHPEDRERIIGVINNVLIRAVSNGEYDVEYRTVGADDKQLRWVRAKGKAYFDANDKAVRFVGSVLDITEQKLDELRKNDFIGMVSHELKTPLTSLGAYLQLVQNSTAASGDKFNADILERANRQVKKMGVMINGFLNVSRLESGKIHLHKLPFDLVQLVSDIVEDIRITVATHTIKLAPCEQIILNADRDKIGSVINNLVSNAGKYSARGTTIHINCSVVDGMAQVSVRDEGIGIKPQDAERLFERFYRVETSDSYSISGFGIGLYLSAEIIVRHKGKIWVESEVGKGSTFFFQLPKAL